MKFIKTILLVVFLTVSTSSFAGWTSAGTLSRVYSHDGYHVIATTLIDNPCGTPGKFWWPADDSDAKDMLAISLTALMAQKNILVLYDENTIECRWSGQLMTHIAILQ